MTAKLWSLAWNLAFVTGSALVVRAAWMLSHPAGLALAGLELAAVGFLGGIDQARRHSWMGDE